VIGTFEMNNAYTITVGSPLLRSGLTISTTTSEKYAAEATERLLNLVRQINVSPLGAAGPGEVILNKP